MRASASKVGGSAMPTRLALLSQVSRREPRLNAQTIPTGTPITSAHSSPPRKSSRVTGAR